MSEDNIDPAIHNNDVGAADGITENRCQETLLKTGALQNAILISANFLSIATDEKGVIQLFNVGAERMLGYTAAEVQNKITPADISDPQEVIARAKALSLELATTIAPGFDALAFKASRGIEDIYELTYIRKDGSRFPAIVSVTALPDDQGAIIGYLLIGTDNSARKHAEAEQQKIDQRLRDQLFYTRSLIESNIDALITTDPSGIITDVNQQMEVLTGCTRDELIGTPFKNYFTDPERAEAGIKLVLSEMKVSNYELTARARDGKKTVVSYNATTFYDRDRTLQGVFAAARDVTEHRSNRELLRESQEQYETLQAIARVAARNRELLRESQERFAAIVESAMDAIVTIDSEQRIVSFNSAAERLFLHKADEVTGKPIDCLLPMRFTEIHHQHIRTFFQSGVTNRRMGALGAVSGLRANGEEFPIEASISHMQVGSEHYGTVILRDITERHKAEQTLRDRDHEIILKNQQLEAVSQMKSDFLSSMSHELRSPLNAILGFAQLMNSDATPATPSQKASIDQILHAGWYLLELINEILDLAVIESGKLSLSEEPVPLAEVMLECQDMIEPQGQKRGIKLTFPQFDTPCFVCADRTRVKQVLLNLLSNAIKYNQPGGTVVVDSTMTTPQRVRISVRDTGAGLPAEKLTQLFQPFNRLGQENSAEEGTGIGLVMSKRLVELMGGVIGVESTVGTGSVFWFELSAAAAPNLVVAPAEPQAVIQTQVQHGAPLRTLLYVEDNPANLKLIEQLIARRPDMRMLSAVDGNLGIELARANLPDVILMDINLIGMSGIQALKILREDTLTAHIPVIAISANAMPLDIKKGLEAGFFRYLTKPIKINDFINALDLALEFAEKNLPRAHRNGGSHDSR